MSLDVNLTLLFQKILDFCKWCMEPLLFLLLSSTYRRWESLFTVASEARSAIWELGVFFWRLVWMEAVALQNNKQVNTLTMHNSLSLCHLHVLKLYSSSGQKTSSRLCPGHSKWKPNDKSRHLHNNDRLGRKLLFIMLFNKSWHFEDVSGFLNC